MRGLISGWLSILSRRKSVPGEVVSLATDSKFEPRSHLTEGFLGCVAENESRAAAESKDMVEGRADAERLTTQKSEEELCALPWGQARGRSLQAAGPQDLLALFVTLG